MYRFDLDTHQRHCPSGRAAHDHLFQLAKQQFCRGSFIVLRSVGNRTVSWEFGSDVRCIHVFSGKRTMRWKALTEAGELWLMLNTPPVATNILMEVPRDAR